MNTSQDKKILSSMSGYQVMATIEALENAGGTAELMRLVRSNKRVAEAMVKAGSKFIYPGNALLCQIKVIHDLFCVL